MGMDVWMRGAPAGWLACSEHIRTQRLFQVPALWIGLRQRTSMTRQLLQSILIARIPKTHANRYSPGHAGFVDRIQVPM